MNLKFALTLVFTLLLGNPHAADSDLYKVERKTVIALAEVMSAEAEKSEEGRISELSAILGQDSAVTSYTAMMVDLCLNPAKYDFPVGDVKKEECTISHVSARVQSDLAYSLVNSFTGEVRGDRVENYLNNFLNTYLVKMKSVIEAFDSWM